MKLFVLVALAAWLSMLTAACAPVTPVSQEPMPTLRPISAGPYHALTVQTGVEQIDRTLAAVASGDPQNVRAIVEFTDAVCTHLEGLGGPPKCREDEAEGTPMQVLAFLSSHGHHLRRDEIENWDGVNAAGVYAAYEVDAAAIASEQYFPIGEYVILLVTDVEYEAVALRIGQSGIVRVDTIYPPLPENLDAVIEREASRVLLAPES